MILVEHYETFGFRHAIRGMRNPMNSWDKSDSIFTDDKTIIGPNDLALMIKLFNAGTEHRKYLRQIFVSMDITAPLYWWKEFDTYKVGTTANSCSTMHKIADHEFTREDFSVEHLIGTDDFYDSGWVGPNRQYPKDYPVVVWDKSDNPEYTIGFFPQGALTVAIDMLNKCRELYLETHDKKYWWQMIQLLPSSYNQKRTVTMTYENVVSMIRQRENHKLDEWRSFVHFLRDLPYIETLLKGGITDGQCSG